MARVDSVQVTPHRNSGVTKTLLGRNSRAFASKPWKKLSKSEVTCAFAIPDVANEVFRDPAFGNQPAYPSF
ncbi:hypothetical protein JQ561_34265 [Bradyrhizobium diazoefficiens]|nr:hypothetical protein [Bradyrhizobium diazoefficiens]